MNEEAKKAAEDLAEQWICREVMLRAQRKAAGKIGCPRADELAIARRELQVAFQLVVEPK